MTNDGYIKLHRSMLKWEWYKDEITKSVFLHLLLNANWEDTKYRGYDVPKGSLVVGRKKMAESLGISEQSIRTALNHLKSTNEITIKSTNKFSIVSIVNWEKFQCQDVELTNKLTINLTNDQPTTNQQLTTYKEYKEIKNIRIDKEREEEREINLEEIQTLFNQICIFFKPVITITKLQASKIKKLGQQYSMDEIKSVFERANKSKFLQGCNDRGWSANFDWLISIENFEKVKDGNFDNCQPLKSNYHNYKHGNYDFEAMEREVRNG